MAIKLDPAIIDAVECFEGLDDAGRKEALAAAQWRRIERGTTVFVQGAPAESFYLLVAGRLKVVQTTADGQQVIVRYIGAKESFGCVAVCGGHDYPASAVAVVDSWALGWMRRAVAGLVERFPAVGMNVMRIMSGRLMEVQDRLRELVSEKVERRIAHAVVRLVAQAGRRTASGIEIDFPISRQDIAEMSGTTLHTVSRVMSAWEADGVVSLGRQRVVINQPHQLVGIAGGPSAGA